MRTSYNSSIKYKSSTTHKSSMKHKKLSNRFNLEEEIIDQSPGFQLLEKKHIIFLGINQNKIKVIDFEDNEFSFNPNFNIKFNLIKDTDNSVYNGIWYKLFTHKYEIKTRGVYEKIDFYALGRFHDNTRKKLVRDKDFKSIFPPIYKFAGLIIREFENRKFYIYIDAGGIMRAVFDDKDNSKKIMINNEVEYDNINSDEINDYFKMYDIFGGDSSIRRYKKTIKHNVKKPTHKSRTHKSRTRKSIKHKSRKRKSRKYKR